MKTYRKLIKKPSTFRQLTGLSVSEFEELLGKLDIVWKEKRDWKNQRSKRRRKPGGGRHHALALAERLTILLMYYRTYITQEFLGFLFGVDKGTVCRNVQEIALLLTGIFRIPEQRVEISADEIAEAFVDATEQPVNRPKKKQRRSYSGKKRRHTIKHQIVVVRKRKKKQADQKEKQKLRIAAVSKAAKGKNHDKKMYDESRTTIPKEASGIGDLGYVGSPLQVPHKKPRKGELTREQKQANRALSRKRIAAKHGIGKMKIWKIASARYRNPLKRHTVMMKNVAGLHNLMFG